MSATDRQNRLLVAEDWKRIYQSFRNADFQSYDFENLRRVMISYIRENYPEDYNDYIESSEYLALIDLIAFMGQSISFRTDLNARENFLELAERRESVLRLARLLRYKAKRNIAASGMLKFTGIQTTQNVFDSNGRNLSGQVVSWNDPANSNWYDQFVKILNAALPASRQFGTPDAKDTIYGIPSEQYRFQAVNSDVPIYSFTKAVDGRQMNFEVVSTAFNGKTELYEEAPSIGNRLSFIYRDDGKGNSSSNTGFFLMFKQGTLNQGSFSVTQPATDETVDIDASNVNNNDVWLYRLDQNGIEAEVWAQVPSFEGNNIIYNSLNKSIKNIYGVVTRAGDKVSLVFSDGTFGNLPLGTFRTYYRVSNGLSYTINPRDIKNVSVDIPYISNTGQLETLTLTLGLQSSVSNSSPTETNDSIKSRAPATYYTQNRMITAEDYNISPLSTTQQVAKIKAVNRSSSGISRYFDLVDPTGKYSKTNLFADDGVIYQQDFTDSFKFSYTTRTDIEAVIYNDVIDTLKSLNLKHFYYDKFDRVPVDTQGIKWYKVSADTNQSTGYVVDEDTLTIQKVGTYTTGLLRFFTVGALVRVIAPQGYYFDKNNNNVLKTLVSPLPQGATTELWTKVVSIYGDGTNNATGKIDSTTGTVRFNDIIPTSADTTNATTTLNTAPVISEIIPAWKTTLDTATVTSMVDLIFDNKPFGLRYDTETRTWKIVLQSNLNTISPFSLGRQGDITNQNIDSSWLLLFTTDTEFYTVTSRLTRYIFESEQQVRFYYDASDKIYDTRNNTVVKDKIKILSINTDQYSLGGTSPLTYDRDWEILEEFKGLDGYVDTKKIQLTFGDTDEDSVVDDPEIFSQVVKISTGPLTSYIVLEKYTISQGQEDYRYIDNSNETVKIFQSFESIAGSYVVGQHYYIIDTGTVYYWTGDKFKPTLDYKVFVGRDNLKFQYIHNADYEARIDPGITNLIDIYVLTKDYDIQYRQWVAGSRTIEPLAPSSDFLYNTLSPELNKIKSISDEIIYHPVKYKVLFGSKASSDVQATFKVVKNSEVVISDNDVKSRILTAISEFFSLENWEFGDNFYFSELSTYVMNRLAPNIVNFIIVPKQSELSFGGLFEIRSEKDQLFINGASIDDIEIIDAITASKIKSAGQITLDSKIINKQSITSSGSN
jgi:hypothetical protein